jgi:hypothetical protein
MLAEQRSRGASGQIVFAGAMLLLAGAIGLQFAFQLREEPQPVARPRISAVLPQRTAAWTGQDESLGATEAVSAAALRTLNLDDYVFRRYSNGSRTFTIYAAYWAAGRMPTRLVASHTPDRCWTENGMRCVDLRFKQTYEVKRRALLPAEYRVFTAGSNNSKETARDLERSSETQLSTADLRPPTTDRIGVTKNIFVLYWHTVEGKLYDYGERFNAIPHPWLWWKDTLAQAAYGSREQLFVRVASETPLDELWQDTGVQELMQCLADLGLWAEGKSGK